MISASLLTFVAYHILQKKWKGKIDNKYLLSGSSDKAERIYIALLSKEVKL